MTINEVSLAKYFGSMSLLCSKAAKTEIPLRAGDLGKMVELTNSPRQKGREGYKIILEGPFHTFLVLNILGLKHNHTSERFPLSTPNSHYTSRLHNPFALTWTPKQDNTHNLTLSGPLCNPHALFYKTHNTKQKRIGFLLTTFNKQDIYYPHLRTLSVHTETTGTKWTNQILPSETHFTPTISTETFHPENIFTDYNHAYVLFHSLEHLEQAVSKVKINGHPAVWLSLHDKIYQFYQSLTKRNTPSCPKSKKNKTKPNPFQPLAMKQLKIKLNDTTKSIR